MAPTMTPMISKSSVVGHTVRKRNMVEDLVVDPHEAVGDRGEEEFGDVAQFAPSGGSRIGWDVRRCSA